MVMALFLILASLLGRSLKRFRRIALKGCVGGSMLFLAACLSFSLSGYFRHLSFESVTVRFQPLIDAINNYEQHYEKSPRTLEALIPNFIDQLPEIGMWNYAEYHYYENNVDWGKMVYVYDLGSRNGREISGRYLYSDGDLSHAILVFITSKDGVVLDAIADRMPETIDRQGFDQESWKNNEHSRINMAHALINEYDFQGKKISDVFALLGVPDKQRTRVRSPWGITIPCSRGVLNWDVFVYWPQGVYPDYMAGGSVERINKWAYVHE